MTEKLSFVVQKSGRLSDASKKLIEECGIEFENSGAKLKSSARNFPMDLLFLRDDDIPECVADGVADAGIVGENVIAEMQADVEVVGRPGFGRCRLSLAVPKTSTLESVEDLEGKRIATSYPSILSRYLKKKGVSAESVLFRGCVELSPSIGVADAICDLVSTGSTLISNGLREIDCIQESEAVLVAGRKLSDVKRMLLEKLLFRVKAVTNAKKAKYVVLNAPNDALPLIRSIIPGVKSPTITPLSIDGWSSLHSVVKEDDFWDVIEKLKEAGAQGILVLPIEKAVM